LANNKSAEKRIRQNERRRVKNVMGKSAIRTAAKKIIKSITDPSNPQIILDNYKDFVKKIDKAAKINLVHKNNAARKKSRLAKKINQTLKNTSSN
jgi:small subunit ribosomal protein S20